MTKDDEMRTQYYLKERVMRETMGCLLAVVAMWIVVGNPVLAQSAGWEQDAVELIDVIFTGLQAIGIAVVVIGIAVVGIWGAITGNVNWQRLMMVVAGGILVATAGTLGKLFDIG